MYSKDLLQGTSESVRPDYTTRCNPCAERHLFCFFLFSTGRPRTWIHSQKSSLWSHRRVEPLFQATVCFFHHGVHVLGVTGGPRLLVTVRVMDRDLFIQNHRVFPVAISPRSWIQSGDFTPWSHRRVEPLRQATFIPLLPWRPCA